MFNWIKYAKVLCLAPLALLGCAGKKAPAEGGFGERAHLGTFAGPRDFLDHSRRVMDIVARKRLDGRPVDMSWITPDFRERLCLTVTINNRCVV